MLLQALSFRCQRDARHAARTRLRPTSSNTATCWPSAGWAYTQRAGGQRQTTAVMDENNEAGVESWFRNRGSYAAPKFRRRRLLRTFADAGLGGFTPSRNIMIPSGDVVQA